MKLFKFSKLNRILVVVSLNFFSFWCILLLLKLLLSCLIKYHAFLLKNFQGKLQFLSIPPFYRKCQDLLFAQFFTVNIW